MVFNYFRTPYLFRKIFPKAVWGFSSSTSIYLTFDDGPDPEITPWVLDELAKTKTKATFFCVGENVVKYPEVFQRILDEGHSVGNHSMKHEKGWNTATDVYLASINQANTLIKSKFFRPPYGKMTPHQYKLLAKSYTIIMWSWLSYDYNSKIEISTILAKAKKDINAGDIIVLHDNKKTKERLKLILPRLIEIIRAKNLTFKTVNQ
jgi:peptidoglycan/xylan/chitin deacetylase (PgdA/CDA1 family)